MPTTKRNTKDAVGGDAYQPTPRECALVLLHLIQTKEAETQKDVTRARFSESTLRNLWLRARLTTEFVHEVQEWLFRAGWTLFFARSGYAAIRTESVEGWVRIGSKRINSDLFALSRGQYNFGQLEQLLIRDDLREQDDE